MAYLFTTALDPQVFQKSFPLSSVDLSAGISGYVFGKIVLLYPGSRDWNQIRVTGNNLIIAAADEPYSNTNQLISVIRNPDSTPAFNIFKSY
jgi:hypothetical protein